jgi:hypothetical protein
MFFAFAVHVEINRCENSRCSMPWARMKVMSKSFDKPVTVAEINANPGLAPNAPATNF